MKLNGLIHKKVKASMTLYMMITTILILSIVFTLLESVRIYGTVFLSKQNSLGVAESVFAGFDRDFYKKYHLYAYSVYGKDGLDFSPVYEAAETVANTTMQPVNDGKSFWLRQVLANSDVTSYRLVTDDGGMGLYQQMAQCAKQEALKDVLTGAKNLTGYVSADNENAFNRIENNANRINEVSNETETSLRIRGASPSTELATTQNDEAVNTVNAYGGNPLTTLNNLKSHGILDLVIENPSRISEKTLDESNLLSSRLLKTGNWEQEKENPFNVVNRGLVLRYVDKYFSSYVKGKRWGALDYEKEYILFGKASDEANLKKAVNRILLVREACNFYSIYQDPVKDAEAFELATAICTLFASPQLISAVKEGIVLAWAYGESILDLRTLLSGGKVALIKTPIEWTLSLKNLGSVGSGYLKARESSGGFDYDMYLVAMLFLQNDDKQLKNIQNLMEANMRTIEGKEKFALDTEVLSMEFELTYQSSPLFLRFVKEIDGKPQNYDYIRNVTYSYLDDT